MKESRLKYRLSDAERKAGQKAMEAWQQERDLRDAHHLPPADTSDVTDEMFEKERPYREPPQRPMINRVVTRLQPWLSLVSIIGVYVLLHWTFGVPQHSLSYVGFTLLFAILSFFSIWQLMNFEPFPKRRSSSADALFAVYACVAYPVVVAVIILFGSMLMFSPISPETIHTVSSLLIGLGAFLLYLIMHSY